MNEEKFYHFLPSFSNVQREMKFYLIFLVFFPSFILAAKKHFHIEHAVDCPESENLPIHTYVEVNNTANVPNKIFFSGYLEIKEKVLGPLEFNYEVNRCDLKAEKCEKFTAMKVKSFHLQNFKLISINFSCKEFANLSIPRMECLQISYMPLIHVFNVQCYLEST